MMDSEEHSPGGAGNEGDCYNWMDYPQGSRKGIDGDTKRRFNEEQIKSLESLFGTQTKLEPKQKLQLARELGLQPRQVSVWFQNKRARWKSKQLEREYNSLQIDYDALLSNFEMLKKEKQLLVKELENLSTLVESQIERNKKDPECNNDGGCDSMEKHKPCFSMKTDSDVKPAVLSDKDYKKLDHLSREKEAEVYSAQARSSTLTEQQFYFQSTWPVDHSTNNAQWWEFWPLNE